MLALGYRHIHPTEATDAGVSQPRRSQHRRQQSRVAHALLAAMLDANLDGRRWELLRAGDGRPEVRLRHSAAPIYVALAHSRSVAACAISDCGIIGVDVEYRAAARPVAEIAAFAFGDGERQAVTTGGRDVFYRIWTLREAYAKASGAGFPLLLDRRDYFPTTSNNAVWQSEIDGRAWIFATGSLGEDYAIAVALAAEHGPVSDAVAEALCARPL